MSQFRQRVGHDVNPLDLAWLAGLLEGEGSFIVIHGTPRHRVDGARISVMMTDVDVINRCAQVTGCGNVQTKPALREGRKPAWTWHCQRRADVGYLLRALHPYMGARRQGQIEACLDALDTVRERMAPLHAA